MDHLMKMMTFESFTAAARKSLWTEFKQSYRRIISSLYILSDRLVVCSDRNNMFAASPVLGIILKPLVPQQ